MSETTELLKKVRRIEIVANRAVNDFFAGQYKSVFRGRGMEFSEVREYQPGDDIRAIDWNVTARAGKPFIKHFVEERELTILFLVDVSASGIFGSIRSKLDTAIEIAATLMFSALRNNDKVGLITFAEQVIDYYRPRKGRANVLHLIRELLAVEPSAQQTNIKAVLDYVNRVQKRRAVVFLLSDFLVPELTGAMKQSFRDEVDWRNPDKVGDFLAGSSRLEKNILFHSFQASRQVSLAGEQERSLSMCVRKHDLIALTFSDPREREFPNVGLLTLRDAETGELLEVDTANPDIRRILMQQLWSGQSRITEILKRCRVDQLKIETGTDFMPDFRRFFHTREKKHL
ncbi:MAG: DUF58 domain-containing protein [Planctomycetaceae bacterium]|jgi:uncharacterized protein (DUF58 family)|nr:DUF58 domain-containing protein [Planctomycetaceae bacterium]